MSLSNAVLDIDAAIAELRARIQSSAERRTQIADKLGPIRDHLRSKECGIERAKSRKYDSGGLGAVMAEDRRRRR